MGMTVPREGKAQFTVGAGDNRGAAGDTAVLLVRMSQVEIMCRIVQVLKVWLQIPDLYS